MSSPRLLSCPAGVLYSPKPSEMPGLMARHVPRIVVVGSGLAGTAAALAAAEAAGPHTEVVVLEKEGRPGACWYRSSGVERK